MKVPTINLLPTKEKKSLYHQVLNEKLIHFFLLISFYLSLLALFLFFTKISISYEKETINLQITKAESESISKKIKENKKQIAIFNEKLKKISQLNLDKKLALEELEKLAIFTPEGITFDSLTIEGNKVQINGIAKDRTTLKKFKLNLENRDKISNLDFPLSNFESPKDISFFISFLLK